MHSQPFGMQRCGHLVHKKRTAARPPGQADAQNDAFGDRPGGGDGVFAAVFLNMRVHTGGREAHRQLPQRDQVALAEEAAARRLGVLRDVDLAFRGVA